MTLPLDRLPPAKTSRVIGAVLVLALAALIANRQILSRPDAAFPAPAAAWERYGNTVQWNDTDIFATQLDESAAALRSGRLHFPLSDYDCPVTFLVAGGAVKILTDWPTVRILNFFALACMFVSGLAAFSLFRLFGAALLPATVTAVAYQTSNFVLYSHQQGHMHNVQLLWIPLAFISLTLMLRQPNHWWPAVSLGAAMGCQVMSSPSLTLYLSYVALPVFVVAYQLARWRRGEGSWRDLGLLAVRGLLAVAVAVMVSAVYLIPRVSNLPRHFPRPLSTVHPFVLYDPAFLLDSAHPMLFLGWPLVIAGVLAVAWWWGNRTPELTAVVATGAAAFLMMVPARFGMPYWFFWRYAPMGDHLRVPNRFFPIFFLMLLAGVAIYLTRRWPGSARPAAVLFAAVVVGNWLTSPWMLEFDFYTALDGVGRKLQSLTGLNLGVT
ncbi:hypothetical protein [Limnoglobus roseus]|uniref:Glycosyltransferase RgtA/B/C/D-like domain-containing protein n=1 Tax=Limnoglobus roseus TaxID=2598579 RepID=A0A5C1AA00_9BACT|nr:hypothetical protein [Limnoglobus roseus]QEL15560.1 hypothetical protein PX52LOC_02485 [Limnoglobus roseus]